MYYNYVYLDPRKPGKFPYKNISFLYEPFYIGKGKGDRSHYHLMNTDRIDNPPFKNKIKKLLSLEIEPYIIKFNFTEVEKDAYDKETFLIKEIGSRIINKINDGPLLNVCLKNQPPNLKGRTYKDIYGDRWEDEIEKRRKLQLEAGGYFGGRNHTEESRMKISKSITGNGNPMWGKKHLDETIKKMSIKAKERLSRNNHFLKCYKITSPDDEIFIIDDGIEKFCVDYNLSYSTLRKCLTTKRKPNRGKTKNWYIEYYEITS